jgi:hypothetical protein
MSTKTGATKVAAKKTVKSATPAKKTAKVAFKRGQAVTHKTRKGATVSATVKGVRHLGNGPFVDIALASGIKLAVRPATLQAA